MNTRELKSLVGEGDARGMVKNRIIGPELGQRIGSIASRNGKVVDFRSARVGDGTNSFIPANVNRKIGNGLYNIHRWEGVRR
jgi:hypothetical protein